MLVGGVFVPNDDQFQVQNYKKDSVIIYRNQLLSKRDGTTTIYRSPLFINLFS